VITDLTYLVIPPLGIHDSRDTAAYIHVCRVVRTYILGCTGITHERIPESLFDLIESPFVVDDTLLTRSDSFHCQLSIRGGQESSASRCIGDENEEQDPSKGSRTAQNDVDQSPTCEGELTFGVGGVKAVCDTGSHDWSKGIGRHPDTW
jgi:hypothetical protein